MSPDEIRAAIAHVKEHPAALYEFRKNAALLMHAALVGGNAALANVGSVEPKACAAKAVAHADALIAALALELEPAAPAAPPPEAELESGRIRPAEWCDPRLIIFVDHGRNGIAGSPGSIFWGERTKDGEDLDTTADGPVFEAIERQYRAGNDSGRVDVMGICYAFQRLEKFN